MFYGIRMFTGTYFLVFVFCCKYRNTSSKVQLAILTNHNALESPLAYPLRILGTYVRLQERHERELRELEQKQRQAEAAAAAAAVADKEAAASRLTKTVEEWAAKLDAEVGLKEARCALCCQGALQSVFRTVCCMNT